MSRICVTILIFLMLFAAAPFANASITTWSCDDDGDGDIVMTSVTLSGDGPYTLDANCSQYDYPGHIAGDFNTDSELDPTVWIVQNVDNYTGFAWTDYHIDIGMDKPFTIIGVVAPSDWTWDITDPEDGLPLPGNIPHGTGWVGSVDYYAGTPIEIDDTGTFGLIVSFAGKVEFCTEQVPTPEPATVSLLGLGALAVMGKRRA